MVGSGRAFAALKTDGSVVTWGHPQCGGDSSAVAAQLSAELKDLVAEQPYHSIFSDQNSFKILSELRNI